MRKAAAARSTTVASRSTAAKSSSSSSTAVRTATNRNSPKAAPVAVKTASKLRVMKSPAPAVSHAPILVKPAAATAAPAKAAARAVPAASAPVAVIPSDPRTTQFRQLLLTRRQELSGNLEDTKFDTLARMGRVAEDDQAQISHEEFISLQRNSMDYQALRQVNAAIERLNTGEYGICANCDEPISEKRLKAIPWAKYCVVCQDRVQAQGAGDSDDDDSATSETW